MALQSKSEKKQEKPKKDTWDKLDVIFKGMVGILISGAIALYGIKSDVRQTEIAEKNRQAQILVQTMNHRESSASEMRAQMFNTLMQHYFKEQDDESTQIIMLELIGLNFQDYLHLKPLFKRLDERLERNSKEQEKLRKAAKQIKRMEIDKIVYNDGGRVIDTTLVGNNICSLFQDGIPLELKLLDVKEDRIKVSSTPESKMDGFEVTYYDMPFMDNSTLGELTYSILLDHTDIQNNQADIKIVILPRHFYSSRNNLRFDALIGDLLEQSKSD